MSGPGDTPLPITDTIPFLLGRLDSKVDLLLAHSKLYDVRLRTVERRQWWATGAAAIIGVVATRVIPFGQLMGLH